MAPLLLNITEDFKKLLNFEAAIQEYNEYYDIPIEYFSITDIKLISEDDKYKFYFLLSPDKSYYYLLREDKVYCDIQVTFERFWN